MFSQYFRIKCLFIRCSRSKCTSYLFPSCSIPTRRLNHGYSNHSYRHTSVTPLDCSNESLHLAFPECIHNFNFHVKRRCFEFLLLLTAKVLSYIGYLVPASCRAEFFQQVFMTDFHSFRRGKYQVIRSFVREEAYEKYSIVAFVSQPLAPRFFYYCRVLIKTVNDEYKNCYLIYMLLMLIFFLILGPYFL